MSDNTNHKNILEEQAEEVQEMLAEVSSVSENKTIKRGFTWHRLFGESKTGHPYDEIVWEIRSAKISKGDGTVVFEQKNVEVPNFWTQTATDIVASKYFRGKMDSPEREYSVKQMIDRVAKTIGYWGFKDGYFSTVADAENYIRDLSWLLVNQYGAFNSPVWFNVGVHERPQCSACFILSVEDNMQSILDWYRDEGWIFKYGSGSGTNLSKLRSSKEPLSRGGYSSGPVSFMKGADGVANSIRSGGTTRRAAKMVVLNVDHPDIKNFIYCKKVIEDMSKALKNAGFKDSIEADIFDPYTLLPYQNANNSVRVTDSFMRAVEGDGYWDLKAVKSGEPMETLKAADLMDWVADAAWHSADPGIQYDTTINEWHTCPNSGRINASNPCSEYMHLDNSACNLASLNLLKFLKTDGGFDTDLFRKAVDTFILAQDVIIDNSSYPTEPIGKNARDFRELGLGYANLGALLMVKGLAYDSDKGRILAGQITSLLCGEAYRMSALLADKKGPFNGYALNRDPMLGVIVKHRNAAEELYASAIELGIEDQDLAEISRLVWHDALDLGKECGIRNSQMTVLAPTGTIAFLMDCDTTGIEPELALIKYKKLVGGGVLKLVNGQVPAALVKLGYSKKEIEEIKNYLLEKETIEGAPYLKDEDLSVFDCSFKPINGKRSIHYMGHVRMMAAAQPFISGAISKTVNLPNDATKEDIKNVFIEGWRLGLKAIAVYRDGCKSLQPLNTKSEDKEAAKPVTEAQPVIVKDELIEKINGYTRRKLPDERPAVNHKFSVGGYESYLTVGFYPDTQKPGETFLTTAKEGSTISGLLDTVATLISIALQSGVPLKVLVRKFKDMRFDPSGFTNNPEIPMAKSIIDYLFRYLGMKYLNKEDREEIFGPDHNYVAPAPVGLVSVKDEPPVQEEKYAPSDKLIAELISSSEEKGAHYEYQPIKVSTYHADAPLCSQCGSLMFKAGSCFSCPNCFATTGVCN
jgi:ribonucleoside-diphosphate reductase alpha chain